MSQGAIDRDFDESEKPYAEQVADALDGVNTDPIPGGIALDLVTNQLLFVRRKVADSLEEHYEREGFDLLTYGVHPFLPVRIDDAAYECVYLSDVTTQNLTNFADAKTYTFPRGRLAHVPVELAWTDAEVGDV